MNIYHIQRGYIGAVVWTADALTRERTGVLTTRLRVGLTRRQRYEVVARWLNGFGISPPPYRPTDK